jgi:competence protein ComEC
MVKGAFVIIFFLHLMLVTVQAEENCRFIVLDVGEGQAVLIQRGKVGVLIDTGHFGRSYDVVKSIRNYGVEKLEFIFLTHLDPDHASGIFGLMENFPEAVIYESGHRIPFNPNLDGYRWVAEALESKRWEVRKILQGEGFDWQGLRFEILWPRFVTGLIFNSQSLVLDVEYGAAHLLVMGDVGVNEENQLLLEKRLPQKVDVLVVGHHGALDAASDAFIQRVQPKYSVISSNKENKRGYPDSKVVSRLTDSGTHLHLTAEQGDFVWSYSAASANLQ